MTGVPLRRPPPPAAHGIRRYVFGIVVGSLCAGATLVATIVALAVDAMIAIAIGIYICLPLLLLLSIVWLVYAIRDRGRMPARAHGWCWLPTLSAALILPAAAKVDAWRKALRERVFPPVSELHVNLTGRDLWVPTRGTSTYSGTAPDMPMRGDRPADFVELTRWAGSVDALPGPLFPYRKGLLLPEFDRLPRQLDAPPDGAAAWPPDARAYAPWTLSNPVPATDALRSHAGFLGAGSLLQYVYYHYADRIEVAPVLRDDTDLWDVPGDALPVPLVAFHAMNMTSEDIVRLEVNGRAVRVGPWGRAVAPMRDCSRGPAGLGLAQIELDAPLRVRWQTSRAPHAWRQAVAPLPEFEGALPPGSRPLLQRAMLYFDQDDRVFVERFQEVELDGGLGVRLTGTPDGLSRPPPCRSALDPYGPRRARVLPAR